ncbi:MAG: ATP-binding cassette domain-containing protein [Chloroflexota bacterium]
MSLATLPVRRFVWRLERFRLWLHVADIVLWVAAGAVPLLVGLVLQRVFDALSGGAPAELTLATLIAILMALAAARMALYVSGVFADLTYRYHLRTLLRRNVLAHLLRGTARLPAPVGDIVNRLYEDATESEELIALLLFHVAEAASAAVAVAVLLHVNVPMTLVALAPVAAAVLLAQTASGRLRRYRTASRQATGRVSTLLGELFGAVQAIQASSKEDAVVAHFRSLSQGRQRAALADVLFAQAVASIQGNTVVVATGALLLLAGQSIRAGTFTVGDLALFVAYLDWLTEFARTMGNYLRQYRQRAVSVQRLVDLLPGAPPEALVRHAPVYLLGALPDPAAVPATAGERLTRLDVSGFTHRYEDSGGGIEGVSFAISGGTLTVITGRIGSGKTTLLRTLLGLAPAASGEIRWNGQVVADPSSFFVPPRCAYVPQAPHLFSDTLKNNILLGLPENLLDLNGALRLAELQPDVAAMPGGLETEVGPRGVRLSGGQVQRTAAARALVREPALLVIDDLTSALDVETERALWDGLKARAAGTGLTVLAVSHRRAALRQADQVVVLKDGAVIGTGTLPALHPECEELRLLWGSGSSGSNE